LVRRGDGQFALSRIDARVAAAARVGSWTAAPVRQKMQYWLSEVIH